MISIKSNDFKGIKTINNNHNMEPKFIGKARVTKQGQLTLPQEARQDLKIGAKSEVYWYELNDILVLVKELVNPKDIIGLVFNKKRKK